MSLWGELLPQMDVFSIKFECFYLSNDSYSYSYSYCFFFLGEKPKNSLRVGPHNIDALSVLFGCLLGDAFAESRAGSTRICFQQENSNASYLYWLHNFLASRGYCNSEKPKLKRKIEKNGKIRFVIRFKTWSFQSLNWIHKLFYENLIKKVPDSCFLEFLLTPLALAVWIMDDGTRSGYGLKIATNGFLHEDLLRMCTFLEKKYKLKVSVNKSGKKDQFVLYFHAKTITHLASLIKPYMIENMKHKLGKYGSSRIYIRRFTIVL